MPPPPHATAQKRESGGGSVHKILQTCDFEFTYLPLLTAPLLKCDNSTSHPDGGLFIRFLLGKVNVVIPTARQFTPINSVSSPERPRNWRRRKYVTNTWNDKVANHRNSSVISKELMQGISVHSPAARFSQQCPSRSSFPHIG